MLKRLHLRNFTVFEDAHFEFGPGLNVLVGTNGTGKSHVLKAGYARLHSLFIASESDKEQSVKGPLGDKRFGSSFLHFITFLERVFQSVYEHKQLIRRDKKSSVSTVDTTVISSGEVFNDILLASTAKNNPILINALPMFFL